MTNIQIGTILIAKEDRFMNGETFKPWVIKGNSYKIIRYRSHEDDYMIIDEQGDEHFIGMDYINQHFTIKRYTITDLNEKKIAVKLKSEEEFKRISPNDDYIWFFDNSYFGYENGQFTFIDNKSLTKQGYILIPSIDLIDLEEKEEEHKPINKVAELIGEASMCWSETPKGIFDSTRASKIVDEIEAVYNSEIIRIKEENKELKDHVTNLKNANGAFAEKILKQKEEIQQLENWQPTTDQSERTRMAWELYVHNAMPIDSCFKAVDSFLAKSKEVGNG